MKNALIPVVTLIGLQLPILVGGSVIIETLFNFNFNLLIDLLYAYLPRPGSRRRR